VLRGWLARRRYRRHQRTVAELFQRLHAEKRLQAAVVLQSAARRFVAYKQLLALREEEELKAAKANPKKQSDLIMLECLDQSMTISMSASLSLSLTPRNRHFFKGLAAFQGFQYVDAIAAFERYLKRHPKDHVALRLLQRAQAGRAIANGETTPPQTPQSLPLHRVSTPPIMVSTQPPMLPGVPILSQPDLDIPNHPPSSKLAVPPAKRGAHSALRAPLAWGRPAVPASRPSAKPPPQRAPRAVSLPRIAQKAPKAAASGSSRPVKPRPKGLPGASAL
jgi:hypothetical protein